MSDKVETVQMGLSQGIKNESGEILGMILGIYMFHNEKSIRSLAKASLSSPELRKIVKKYWQAEYRTQSWIWDGWIQKMIVELEEIKIRTIFIGVFALKEKNKNAKSIIRMIGNCIYETISSEMCDDYQSDDYGVILFNKTKPKKLSIHEVDAIGVTMINVIEFFRDDYRYYSYRQSQDFIRNEKGRLIVITAIEILGDLNIVQAVDLLIRILNNKTYVQESVKALRIIGDERAVKPIARVMENVIEDRKRQTYWGGWSRTHTARWRDIRGYAKALGKIGDLKSLKILVKGFQIRGLADSEKESVKKAMSEILERANISLSAEKRKNVIKFLSNKDPAMVAMGESLLKGMMSDSEQTSPQT